METMKETAGERLSPACVHVSFGVLPGRSYK
jgi:hypothetical protein